MFTRSKAAALVLCLAIICLAVPCAATTATTSLLSGFEPGHAWSKVTGTYGSWWADTTHCTEGSQSYAVTTSGDGTDCKSRWTSISPARNLTGRFLAMDIMVDNATNLNRLWLYAASSPWSAYYCWKPSDAPSQWLQSGSQWITITLSFTQAATQGTPARSSVVALQLYVTDKAGGPVTVCFDNLRTIDQPTKGIVSYAFDDGWQSQYTEAYQYMHSAYGMPATLYAAYDRMDTEPGTYLSTENLTVMHTNGWEIAGHYSQALDSVEDLTAVLAGNVAWQAARGFYSDGNDYAYPDGVWSPAIIEAVDDYYASGRTISPYSETLPPGSPYRLRVLEVFNTTSVASINAAIASCAANGDWCLLVFHRLVTTPSSSMEYSISSFRSVVDYTYSSGVEVRTVRQTLGNAPAQAGGAGVIPSGSTSAVIYHGLLDTPSTITVTPKNRPDNDVGFLWVDSENFTAFTVRVDNDPGDSGLAFWWGAET